MSESTTNSPDEIPEPAEASVNPVVASANPVWPSATPAEFGNAAPVSPTGAMQVVPAASQTSSSAIVALVLSVGSWAVCPIVLAIIALVFAAKADKEIARSRGALQGGGMVTAAKVVAWVNIGVSIAVCVILVFVVIIALIAGGLHNVSPAGQV